MGIKRTHKGCGGVILNSRCSKCGKVWGPLKWYFAKDIDDQEEKFDPKEYRKRIREGRDLP
jgi:uncharacterized OB-fold protein